MSSYSTFKRVLHKGPRSFIRAVFDKTRYWNIYHLMPDKCFISLAYWVHFGKRINLYNPISFNEKLQWLKLFYRKEEYVSLVDKVTVKNYVSSIIGAKYIVPTLGVWQSFDSIDLDSLPPKFVLKCNHDSGSVIVCHDKANFDKESARRILNRGLQNNLFWWGREWPYKHVKPCIFAEQLLEDKTDGDLKDYKFFCFNGIVKCFKIDFNRFTNHQANYYDRDGVLMKMGEDYCAPDYSHEIILPDKLDQMIVLAETLSKGEPFVRVDFYYDGANIYFGELTFYPASGLSPFLNYSSDELLGSWLDLPNNIIK